jgi:hypothetical protein
MSWLKKRIGIVDQGDCIENVPEQAEKKELERREKEVVVRLDALEDYAKNLRRRESR